MLTILQSEDLIANEKLRPHLIDPSKLVQLRAIKAANAAADVAINGMVATFAAITNPSDKQLLDHHTAVQFRRLIKVLIIG